MFIPEALKRQKERIRSLEIELKASQRELADQKWVFDQFLKSPSWRLTYPVRWLAKRLRLLRSWLQGGSPAVENTAPSPEPAEEVVHPDDDIEAGVKALFTSLYEVSLEAFLTSKERLRLPRSAEPEVSIILVLFNRAELTLACLRSITEIGSTELETIIVDNASFDRTAELLDLLEGVHFIRNPDNLNFLVAVNQAAKQARGKYLLLLNNDAQLQPGALKSALETIREAPDIGAVGARIILLDGTLQEAGSVVWRDGSCLGYGRGANPSAFPYMFRRDVDYCSGAFLLTPRAVWEKLGGFDEVFKPAYYEETDYCFRLRQAGLRVVYDPGAAIIHYEFASSSSSNQAIELQAAHQRIFAERHKRSLLDRPQPDVNAILLARTRSSADRILFIDDRVPHRRLGSGFPRARTILLSLVKRGFLVTMYPLSVPNEQWFSIYSDLPPELEVACDLGPGMLEEFIWNRRGYYDAILVSRPHNMERLKEILTAHSNWFENVRIIYDAEALFASRVAGLRRLQGETLSEQELARIYEEEIEIASAADCVIAVSEPERSTFKKFGLNRVHILGHTLPITPALEGFSQRRGFLFAGAIHEEASPNGDAIIWFVEQVWPTIQAKLGPAATLRIAGVNSSERVRAYASSTVKVLGPQDDLTPLYESARVFIAPTRYAAGIPHKVHEAAAHGLPVVATPLLASQLQWRDGVQLAVAEDTAAFAAKCLELHENEALWTQIRDGARRAAERDCSPDSFESALDEILSEQKLGEGRKRFADVGMDR